MSGLYADLKKKPKKKRKPRESWWTRVVTKAAIVRTVPNLIRQVFTTVVGAAADGDDASMVVSTPAVDRAKDRVIPEGGNFDNFRKNPVLLWAHRTDGVPIGAVTRITAERAVGVGAAWRWVRGDEFADRVRRAWEQGAIRAASIGFTVIESQRNEFGGTDFLKWELAEISLVPVPANPEATRRLKTLGLLPGHVNRDEILSAVRRGIQDALDPQQAALRRAAEVGLARAFNRRK